MLLSLLRMPSIGGFILANVAMSLAAQTGPHAESSKTHNSARASWGGFTGSEVPSLAPLLGDYGNVGVRTPQNRTDIPRLLVVLKEMGARDYMHLVWREKTSPSAWQDFQQMAPEFQKANVGLWLYLTPPSEGVPDPFGGDYVRWAVECAEVAKQYPVVKGICIDDFNGNVKKFTPSYCKQMMREAHRAAPHLCLLVVCYFGYERTIASHVEEGAIDGVVFPYFYPHKNLSDTTILQPQIESYRRWLDQRTRKGGLPGKMPLVVMVYAAKHSQSRDEPTPAYVGNCLEIGLGTTRSGLTDGVVTYCLPKDNPSFVKRVTAVYKGWESRKK
ncbi:MAG TPA: hypothetical protein DD670_00220 [Planctomycetaceae bacterium]|nr:hypothetical protein [Planctomycetaceae bacterium]